MRVPFCLLFVGWWTAGHQWMVTGQVYSKPLISVRPEVVTLGGKVTVRCSNASHPGAQFFLHKGQLSVSSLSPQKAKGHEAEFTFSNIKISDAGIYWCFYRFQAGMDSRNSHRSDYVHINVTDPSIPKPSIEAKPGSRNDLDSNVTIECQGQGDGLNFFLRKASTREVAQVGPVTSKAAFPFIRIKKENAGSYICQYHHENTPFVWSVPSDPVELVLKDPDLSKPCIKVRPKGQHEIGAKVTIKCEGFKKGMDIFLHKPRNLTVPMIVKGDDRAAKLYFPAVTPEDAGNYTCRYCHAGNPFVCSDQSDPAQVIVTDSHVLLDYVKWASVAGGLLVVLLLLVLILVLCKKRKKHSSVKAGNQPVNRLPEQNAGADHGDTANYDGVTYAVLKIKPPASQSTGPESCVYASVAEGRTRKV